LDLVKPESVTCIKEDMKAYDAFKLMFEKKVSGLAVVNMSGVLVGNISASDIKLIGWNMKYWNFLGLSVTAYLKEMLNFPEIANFTPEKIHGICCRKNDKLSFIIRTLCYLDVHRIFVVDENKVPIGMVTILDVVEYLMKEEGTQSQ